MKIISTTKLSNEKALHAPWGKRRGVRGQVDEAGVEFQITREDFKNPLDCDEIFGLNATVTCFAICSRVVSDLGCQVNNREVFVADKTATEKWRAKWIAQHQDPQSRTVQSQAHAQQWMTYAVMDFVKRESRPEVAAELLNA